MMLNEELFTYLPMWDKVTPARRVYCYAGVTRFRKYGWFWFFGIYSKIFRFGYEDINMDVLNISHIGKQHLVQ